MASVGAAPGCADGKAPTPTVSQISPEVAFNDTPVPLEIFGGPFRPAYDLDTSSSRAMIDAQSFTGYLRPVPDEPGDGLVSVPLGPITWLSLNHLRVELPSDIIVGVYDVVLSHASGVTSTLPAAFVSLGPDAVPPSVFIELPVRDDLVGAGSDVAVRVVMDDGPGRITRVTWSVDWDAGPIASGACEPSLSSSSVCLFSFKAPTPTSSSDVLFIGATATDGGGNRGSTRPAYLLVRAPTVSSVEPRVGPAQGGTVLTIRGADFFRGTNASAGTRVLVGGAETDPTTLPIEQNKIVVVTPPGNPGFAPITVQNGRAVTVAGSFEYVGAPNVRAIYPASGPVEGGTLVTVAGNHFREGTTRILFGGVELRCTMYDGAQRIRGVTPPSASPGPVTVTAVDPVGGVGRPQAEPYIYEAGDASTPESDGGCPANAGP
jgi:hypothetical protein